MATNGWEGRDEVLNQCYAPPPPYRTDYIGGCGGDCHTIGKIDILISQIPTLPHYSLIWG